MAEKSHTELRPTQTPCEAHLELCQNEVERLRAVVQGLEAEIRRLRRRLERYGDKDGVS